MSNFKHSITFRPMISNCINEHSRDFEKATKNMICPTLITLFGGKFVSQSALHIVHPIAHSTATHSTQLAHT